MLEVKNLSVSYGAIEAVKDISFTVKDGEIVSLIARTAQAKPPRCTPSPVWCRLNPVP